jgi:polyhydroxyalkanoate synthase subunit PhaC
MSQVQEQPFTTPDPADVANVLSDISSSSERILKHNLSKGLNGTSLHDELGLGHAFSSAKLNLLFDPFHLAEQQLKFLQDSTRLWQSAWMNLFGYQTDPVIEPARSDARFKDELWDDHPMYDFIKQGYLLAARTLYSTLTGVKGLDDRTAGKVEFFTRQFIDALAPTNFLATNPAAQREFLRTGGMSVLKGLRNLLADMERGKGQLRIRMTDLEAFELGKNIAVTPGKVVHQTPMMQLIQYSPSTDQVYKRPLLIVPPWINKFYILDLRPRGSFIKWAVDQGHTVFVISWVNPDSSYADKTFDDYLNDGVLGAVDAIEQATGEKSINAVGYCLGGTLLGASLAYMAAKRNTRIKSATYFTTLLDFEEPGDLGVFIDEGQLAALDRRMERGYLDGSEMATTFNMLRANDLIWSFAINNYLLGKEPFPFDLLYWNSDSTRMPAAMHRFYLRTMYQQNLLREPNGITLNGTGINLSRVKIPSYFLSTREDHIAPWKATYAGVHLLSGDNRFVLAGSGHIAGVINPPNPDKLKYGYWTNPELPEKPEAWQAGAEQHPGSWWPDWQNWVSSLDDARVPARQPGDGALPVLEDAPGSYVKTRIA